MKTGAGTGYPVTGIGTLFISLDDNKLIETEVAHDGGNFYKPQMLITKLKSNTNYQFFYLTESTTSNDGIYISNFLDTVDPFMEPLQSAGGSACTSCSIPGPGSVDARCAHGDLNRCMICKANTVYVYNHMCYDTNCANYSYKVVPTAYPTVGYCVPCHKTCKTCSGPLRANCSTCNTANADPELDRTLSGGLCLCTVGTKYTFKGKCYVQCDIHNGYAN
jgi:hypothetical protein